MPTDRMIEILQKWEDEASWKAMDFHEWASNDPEMRDIYWYWNIYSNFLFHLGLNLEQLKAHDSPQNKRATMLNRVNSGAFLYQEAFPTYIDRKDKIEAQAHIDASLRAKELFTAWDPTGDPIRKYKVFSHRRD